LKIPKWGIFHEVSGLLADGLANDAGVAEERTRELLAAVRRFTRPR